MYFTPSKLWSVETGRFNNRQNTFKECNLYIDEKDNFDLPEYVMSLFNTNNTVTHNYGTLTSFIVSTNAGRRGGVGRK